eukprot:scaffold32212_cov34-Isochrysis_galbana.AAC.1
MQLFEVRLGWGKAGCVGKGGWGKEGCPTSHDLPLAPLSPPAAIQGEAEMGRREWSCYGRTKEAKEPPG